MTTIVLNGIAEQVSKKQSTKDHLFSTLVSQYANDVYRYAYWIAGNKHVAEDLAQETMMRAWKSIDKLNDAKAIKSWLFTIVRRENARRFERKQAEFTDMPVTELAQKQLDYDTSTEAFVVRQALKHMPLEYREPLLLQVIHGYSQKEIATHLGISTAGAGTRLFRARQKLRELLV